MNGDEVLDKTAGNRLLFEQGKGKLYPVFYSTKPVDIRTTTTTVISLTEQSLQIDVDASMGAVFFEDRKTGETLSIELTGDQLTNLANVIRNVSVT